VAILRTFARMAFQRLASDPEIQAKIARVVKREIIPRAQQGWEQAKPELKKAKSKAEGLARKLQHKSEN